MFQTLANGRVVLSFILGTNSSTKRPQWQGRANGVLYVPHFDGMTPTENGEAWECKPIDQIGGAGRRGSGVMTVWLIERHVPAKPPLRESKTQKRKLGLEAHRRELLHA